MSVHSTQKAKLTRAINSRRPEAVRAVCAQAVRVWNQSYWPDDWSAWQRALNDAGYAILLEDC